jgi:aspartyl-tRNA(Asn)/glutamyl-tRNA(Gln) amidotransferase subunit B
VAPRKAANWISGHLLPALKERGQGLSDTRLTPERFAGLILLLDQEKINAGAAREVLVQMLDKDAPAEQIVSQGGFEQVSDADKLETIVDAILAEHPDDVADYKKGNAKVLGFFMGLAMKASQGKANPKLLKDILAKRLDIE